MAVNGYLIYYAQEVRMYSLLLFFTLCSLWVFVRFFNNTASARKDLLVLFIINLLLVYTQYYGWLVVGMELLSLLAWRREKLASFSASVAVLILCFIPWVYKVAQVAAGRGLESNIGSFQRPNLVGDFAAYYVILTAPFRPLWVTFMGFVWLGYSFLLWTARVNNGSEDKREIIFLPWLLLFSFLPSILSFAISQIFPQSIWGTRFLIIVAAPYLILVAVVLYRSHQSWIRQTSLFLAVGWASLGGFQEVNRANKNAWEPVVRQMIAAEQSQARGIPVYTFGSSDEVITFYLEEARDGRFRTIRVKDVADIAGNHFWVALRESLNRSPRQTLISNGYRVGKEYHDGFDGLLFPVWRQ